MNKQASELKIRTVPDRAAEAVIEDDIILAMIIARNCHLTNGTRQHEPH